MGEKGVLCNITSVLPDYNGSEKGTLFCPDCWKPKGTDPQDPDYVPGFVCSCGGEHAPVQPLNQVVTGVLSHA